MQHQKNTCQWKKKRVRKSYLKNQCDKWMLHSIGLIFFLGMQKLNIRDRVSDIPIDATQKHIALTYAKRTRN